MSLSLFSIMHKIWMHHFTHETKDRGQRRQMQSTAGEIDSYEKVLANQTLN